MSRTLRSSPCMLVLAACRLLASCSTDMAPPSRAAAEPLPVSAQVRLPPPDAGALPQAPSPQEAALIVPHDLRSLGAHPGNVHRFRIPLARSRFSFVDLHYETPLVDARADHALVFNGGYWAYAGKRRIIQGLVTVRGVEHAPKVPASGGVLEVRDGEARMIASDVYEARPGAELAVQCSPRLVADGRVIPRLDALHRAARTALCIGEDPHTLDVYLTDAGTRPTLAQLGEFLRAEGCVQALNLDGGPSTAAVAQAHPAAFLIGRGEALPYGFAVDLTP